MEPELAFLMANLAQVRGGAAVLDPCCGSGGLRTLTLALTLTLTLALALALTLIVTRTRTRFRTRTRTLTLTRTLQVHAAQVNQSVANCSSQARYKGRYRGDIGEI